MTSIFDEIKGRAMEFAFFSVWHVNREANVGADLCAKHATALSVSDCWLESAPSFIAASLMADYNRISIMQ